MKSHRITPIYYVNPDCWVMRKYCRRFNQWSDNNWYVGILNWRRHNCKPAIMEELVIKWPSSIMSIRSLPQRVTWRPLPRTLAQKVPFCHHRLMHQAFHNAQRAPMYWLDAQILLNFMLYVWCKTAIKYSGSLFLSLVQVFYFVIVFFLPWWQRWI